MQTTAPQYSIVFTARYHLSDGQAGSLHLVNPTTSMQVVELARQAWLLNASKYGMAALWVYADGAIEPSVILPMNEDGAHWWDDKLLLVTHGKRMTRENIGFIHESIVQYQWDLDDVSTTHIKNKTKVIAHTRKEIRYYKGRMARLHTVLRWLVGIELSHNWGE